MAGPCSVESEEQILEIAHRLREAGATILRGGAFKPRSSPYSFQGLGEAGLRLLARAREETGMAIVTEAIDPEGVDASPSTPTSSRSARATCRTSRCCAAPAARASRCCSSAGWPPRVKDLLLSAEYILAEGNGQVILCERGVRGFDTHTRNLLDLTAIPVVKSLSHLPIIADPSHGTGIRAR
jgi:3-deoxy-7-phosphoheptulonate synthase